VTAAFARQPGPSSGVRELLVDTGDGVALSGLVAEPAGGRPRALLVAVHGFGLHAGYFDAHSAPGLSLLGLAADLGFSVWAPDRPGYGATADLPAGQLDCPGQARRLIDGIEAFAAEHPVGGGILLVTHSYGSRIGWSMAADPRLSGLLGIDAAGNGIRYPSWADDHNPGDPLPAIEGERGYAWGPNALYPPGTFQRGALPVHDTPPAQAPGSLTAQDGLDVLGPRIRVPVRLTFGEYERYWRVDDEHFAEIRGCLPNVPSLDIEILRHAGHNISLGYSARSHHLKVLAFAEACLLARALG
jgi:pimeloyl-ACP methyl ester carboxylesterase